MFSFMFLSGSFMMIGLFCVGVEVGDYFGE